MLGKLPQLLLCCHSALASNPESLYVSDWQCPFNNNLIFYFPPSLLMCNHRAGISMLIAWNCITQVWKTLLALPACVCSPPLLSDAVAPVFLWGVSNPSPISCLFFPTWQPCNAQSLLPLPPAYSSAGKSALLQLLHKQSALIIHCAALRPAPFLPAVSWCAGLVPVLSDTCWFLFINLFSACAPYNKNSFLFLDAFFDDQGHFK